MPGLGTADGIYAVWRNVGKGELRYRRVRRRGLVGTLKLEHVRLLLCAPVHWPSLIVHLRAEPPLRTLSDLNAEGNLAVGCKKIGHT